MDNYPIWSAAFVGLMGGFGYTFSTDGWTNLICRKLFVEYQKEIRVLSNRRLITRTVGLQDGPGTARWNGPRAQALEICQSQQVQDLLDYTVKGMVAYLERF
jgi:hypothetical protein